MPTRTRFVAEATELGAFTRDLRADMYADTQYEVGRMPFPLYYQPANKGHDDAELVGGITAIEIGESEVLVAGFFLDGEGDPPRILPIAAEAIALAREQLVNPSIDMGVLELQDRGEDMPPLMVRADIGGVTLVGMPAFAGTSIAIIGPDAAAPADAEAAEPVALVAAVRRDGWRDLPVADRSRSWDGREAAKRLAAHCGVDDDDAGADAWACYAAGFLHRDDAANPRTRGAYGFGIVDVIDGRPTIVPQGVIGAASVLVGARGGTNASADDQRAMREVLGGIYAHMRDVLDGFDLVPPWDTDRAAAALVASVVEPVPAAVFERPPLEGYQPGYRIEGRRIMGHLGSDQSCHLNWPDRCVTPPESPSAYSLFRRYEIATDAGPVDVGRFTTGLGQVGTGCTCCDPERLDDHACPRMGLVAAMTHHDGMPVLADLNVGEHDGVIWASGLLREDLPDGAHDVLARRVWSGDWRPVGAAYDLTEVLALHHGKPGFTHRVKHSRSQSRVAMLAAVGPLDGHDTAAVDGSAEPSTGLDAAAVHRIIDGRAAAERLAASVDAATAAATAAALHRLESTCRHP